MKTLLAATLVALVVAGPAMAATVARSVGRPWGGCSDRQDDLDPLKPRHR